MSATTLAGIKPVSAAPPASPPVAGVYMHRRRWSPPGTWNRDRVVSALKDWTTYTGSPPRSYEWSPATAAGMGLASARVRLWSEKYPRWPSEGTVCRYFGRWSTALEAAGLEPHRRVAPGAGRAARVEAAKRMAADGIANRVIAEILEVSPRTVRAYLRAGRCAGCGTPVVTRNLCPKCAARKAAQPKVTRTQIVAAIRAWTAETGRTPRLEDWAPSSDPRRKWAREYPRWPSYMTVRTHFGGWRAALEAAGYTPHRVAWDARSITRVLRVLASELARTPKSSDLERPGLPAPATVRAHFGSFGAALEAAGFRPRRRGWSRAAIVEAVAAFHRRHGRLPSERDWDKSTAEHPHATTVRRRFGSWRDLMRTYGSH